MGKDISFTDSGFENPPVTLKDIIRKITRAGWWIFTSVIVILTGTIYVSYSTPPIYQATVSVMIEKRARLKQYLILEKMIITKYQMKLQLLNHVLLEKM